MKPIILPMLALAALLGISGCTTSDISVPARSGIEQLLLSTAADNALKGVKIPQIAGEKVYLVTTYIESYDKPYVIGSIRALLSENGALIQQTVDDADIIVEARVGALGMDASESLVGMPSLPIPIPSVGSVQTPELALYGTKKKDSVSKIALLGYYKDGSNLFSTEPLAGTAYFHQYKFLLMVNVNFTDIPEREGF
jgi:hypothetical protein